MKGEAVAEPRRAEDGLEGRLAFTLTVPQSWYELDLNPTTCAASIRQLVEDRVRGNVELWAQRRPLMKVLEAQAQAAHEAGGTYCAAFSMRTDAGPVTGSVMVSLVRDPAALLADAVEELARDLPWGAVASGFTEVPRGEDPLAPFTVTTSVDIETCGSCPRTYGIDDAALGDGAYVRNVFMLTAVPVADLGRVFLVAASSPVLPLADVLHDLFDAVTGTFRVVRLDRSVGGRAGGGSGC